MNLAIQLLLTTLGAILQKRGQEDLADYLELAGSLIRIGTNGLDELEALTQEIQAMADAGLEPTAEQRAKVVARRTELARAFQDAREEFRNS
jgi:hypothetical protein